MRSGVFHGIGKVIVLLFIFWMGFLCGSFFIIRQVRVMTGDDVSRSGRTASEYVEGTVYYGDADGGADGKTADAWKAGNGAVFETLLVNASHPLEGYTPELVIVERGYQVDAAAAEDLKSMLEAGRTAGYDLKICSAYRSLEKQTQLFEKKTREYLAEGMEQAAAEAEAAKTVARPGTSEHHSGFAVDIVSEHYQLLDEKQADTPEQQWLMKNCSDYGFILRYPTDKTKITGIIYEPWHYRYVGRKAAKEIMEQGICLEEYLGAAD